MMLTLIAETGMWDLLPRKASTFTGWVDSLFYFELWLSAVCFVGIGACMAYFVFKYRRRDPDECPHGSHHNNTLEITWSVIPLIIVLGIFVWGFAGFIKMTGLPASSLSEEVVVTASRWNWSFQYANGGVSPGARPTKPKMDKDGNVITNEAGNPVYDDQWGLIVPVNKPVRIVLKTPLEDVLHSMYIPAFRVKKDAVPGRYNTMWFEATEMGEFDLFCAEYCGQQHSQMRSRVKVVSEDEYHAYITDAADIFGKPPAEAGELVFKIKGCSTCHSVNPDVPNQIITGPWLRDLFGREETFTDGTKAMVDENYIMESVRNPSARIVGGFQDQMTVMPVSDQEMDALISYLKSISEHYTGDRDALFAAPETKAQ